MEEYHKFLRNEPEVVIEKTHKALDVIFSKLQCLPFGTNKAILWARRLDNLKLKVVVNPLYYKITKIRSTPRGKQVPRVTASGALLQQRIFKKTGAGELNTLHLEKKRARREREYEEEMAEREGRQKARRKARRVAKQIGEGQKGSRRGRDKNYRRPPGWALDLENSDTPSDSSSSGSTDDSESRTVMTSRPKVGAVTPLSSDDEEEEEEDEEGEEDEEEEEKEEDEEDKEDEEDEEEENVEVDGM